MSNKFSLSNKVKVILVIISLAGAAAFGRFTSPTKVVEKEHIVYQEKIVEKKVYVKDKDIKKNVVTIRLVTIKPDGTRTIETKTYDKSEIEIVQKGGSEKTDDVSKETDKTKTAEYKHDEFLISLGAKMDASNLSGAPTYGLLLNKRLLGPIYVGAFGFLDKSFGVTAGLSF